MVSKLFAPLLRLTNRRLYVVFFALCLLLVFVLHFAGISPNEFPGVSRRPTQEEHAPATRRSEGAARSIYVQRQYTEWLQAEREKQTTNSSEDLRPGSEFTQQQALVQRKRKALLQEVCRRHPELAGEEITKRNARLLHTSDKNRLFYCAVPKAGCTNWKKVLMVLEGSRQHVWNITGYEAHHHNHLRNLSYMLPEEREYVIKAYTKFLYVRHPFVRLISAYRNKIARPVSEQGTVFRNIAKNIVYKYREGALMLDLDAEKNHLNVTWDEWISYLTDPSEVDEFNPHWKEMYKICYPCMIQYDFVGKLETVAADSKYMLSIWGLDRVSYPISAALSSDELYDEYYANVSRRDLQRLLDVYQLDFELFGFGKPDPLEASVMGRSRNVTQPET